MNGEEKVEIKAGEIFLSVPATSEGMKVVRAMVTLLETMIEAHLLNVNYKEVLNFGKFGNKKGRRIYF